MKKFSKLSAVALASTLFVTVLAAAPTASAATCSKKTTVEMLGTIKTGKDVRIGFDMDLTK